MKKLVVVLFTLIASMVIAMTSVFADTTDWMTVREFDTMVTQVYHGNGMLWGDVSFTAGGTVLINVYCDENRIDYRILKEDEWKVEDQTLMISYAAIVEMIAESMPAQTLGEAMGLEKAAWLTPNQVFSILPVTGEGVAWHVVEERIISFTTGGSPQGFVICEDDQFLRGIQNSNVLVPLISTGATFVELK